MDTKFTNSPLPPASQMGLAALQKVIIDTCTSLNRPVRKSLLPRFIIEFFECCTTPKQISFALLGLIETKQLLESGSFLVTPEFASGWDKNVTAMDEGIIRFFLSLKEEAKHNLFFNVYAEEKLTPSSFFKYVGMTYPSLLRRNDAALALMEQMANIFPPNSLNYEFYVQLHDYPLDDRWLTKFFSDPDRRIIIRNIFSGRNYANFQIILVSGRKGSFQKAYQDFNELRQNIPSLFSKDMEVQVKKSLITISAKRQKGKKKYGS